MAKIKSLNLSVLILAVTFIFIFTGSIFSQDLEGDTVTIGSFWPLEENFKGEGEQVEWREYVEEEFNCKIEFTQISPPEFIDTIISGVMAGEPVADIFIIHTPIWLDSLANAGAIYPVGELLTDDYYNSLPSNHQKLIKEYAEFDGKIWGFSTNDNADYNSDMATAMGIVWNKALFEEEGLPDIYELQEAGEWNWEMFREIADDATRDTSGDGEIDQWGVQAPNSITAVMFAYTNGAQLYKEVDGRMEFSFDEEPALEALRLWQNMINVDESVHPDAVAGPDVVEEFVQGNIAMLTWDAWALGQANNQGMEDYGWALLPKAPRAEEYKAPLFQTQMAVLPVTVEKPEALVEVGSALFRTTDEYRDMDEYLDDVTEGFGDIASDYQSVENYRKMFENPIIYPHPASPILGMGDTSFWEQVDAVIHENESPSGAMDAVEPEVQSVLDEIFN